MSSSDASKPTTSEQQQQEGYYDKAKHMASDSAAYVGQKYNEAYESYVPWLEDKYLQYFTKDNKASYATKGMFIAFSITLILDEACGDAQIQDREGAGA